MSDTLLDCYIIEPEKTATHSVIWMHGLGANAQDFTPLVPYLRLPPSIQMRFVFPNAPQMPITINNGYVMPAWYDILNTNIGSHDREDAQGLHTSQHAINALIEREIQQGVPSEHIYIAGFSQGGAMTLMVGLRYPKPLAGLICLSGYLPLASTTPSQAHPSNRQTPILMVHGSQDPIVPMTFAKESYKILQDLGYSVTWHDYPMQHEVCAEEIQNINDFFIQHHEKTAF